MVAVLPSSFLASNIELDLYANFIFLKYFFKNGCVYNYNHHQLSLKTGKSHRFIKRTVEYAIKKKWCEFHGKNLIFKSRINQKFDKFKKTVSIEINSLQQIKLELRRLLIENKLRQCSYALKSRSDLHNPLSLLDFKRARKNAKKLKQSKGEMNNDLKISYLGLGKVLKCGKSQAVRVVKKLCLNGTLQKTRNKKAVFFNKSIMQYKALLKECSNKVRYVFSQGVIYSIECNSYEYNNIFNHSPLNHLSKG